MRDTSYNGKKLFGPPKITLGDKATDSFWTEGAAGYILACRTIQHENPKLQLMTESLRSLKRPDGSVPYSVGVSYPDVTQVFQPIDLVVADFEAHPNRLYGNVGIFGDAEPDWEAITIDDSNKPYSWYYESKKMKCNDVNVHSGCQSFRLVNAGKMCKYKRQGWATFGLDLGPISGCQKIRSVDVSPYKKLSFWARTDNKDGATAKVIFRDLHKRSYYPQADIEPPQLSNSWQKHTVNLDNIGSVVDLQNLTNVSLSFGHDIGNDTGTVIYIDDIAFIGSEIKTDVSNGSDMPPVSPRHWPFGSVAGSAWLVFVELDTNPFGPQKKFMLDTQKTTTRDLDLSYCQQYTLPCSILNDWVSISANLDASYRKTLFYENDMHAEIFNWDARVDLWLPPFREEFTWGPYVRIGGITSNKNSRDFEWLNNWNAHPGFGFQIYPFSSRTLKEEGPEFYADLAKPLGSLRLFIEHNEIRYWGKGHSWRPDELVRVGADYWKDFHIDDIRKPYWGEIWNGLIWNSSNGWDNDYDTLIFANALRLGARKPNSGLISMFTPYFALESSLSENRDYAWENRLLLGGGVRFAPPLKYLPPAWNLTRFVIYAEYLNAAAYYRSSVADSRPDDDFRVGINIYIGEWWPR
jgi:hypothetical protein